MVVHRMSRLLAPTLKQNPSDAFAASHQLLMRAGMIRPVADEGGAGLYSILPLGLRIIHKIEREIDLAMSSIGGQRVALPVVVPAALWDRSGRRHALGDELASFVGRNKREYVISATHEECITSLVAGLVPNLSSSHLPLLLYQIGVKFRDEARPRYGLLRTKEFVMKDLYSFHKNEECAEETYHRVVAAYTDLFMKWKIPLAVARAVTGAMGGSMSHEFHALTPIGEDVLLRCHTCGMHCNKEFAEEVIAGKCLSSSEKKKKKEEKDQSNEKCDLRMTEELKGIELGHCFILGRRYSRAFNCFVSASNTNKGKNEKKESAKNNRLDTNVAGENTIEKNRIVDVNNNNNDKIDGDDNDKMVMGCYGIGVSRMLSAAAEVHRDENGLAWPESLSPFLVCVVILNQNNAELVEAGQRVATKLSQRFVDDVILDDRVDKSGGEKMKDAMLIGYSFIVVVGAKNHPQVELRHRVSGETFLFPHVDDLLLHLNQKLSSADK